MQDFYIAREGAAYGPVTIDETNRLVGQGELDLTTMVWDDDTNNWVVASQHPVIAQIYYKHVKEEAGAAVAAAEKKLRALEDRCKTQEKVLSTLEGRCRDKASEESSARENYLKELDERCKAQEKVLATLEIRCRDKASEESSAKEKYLRELEDRCKTQEKVLATLEARCREKASEEIAAKEIKLRDLNNRLEAQEKTLATLENRCREKASDEIRIAREVEGLESKRAEVIELEARLSGARAELDSLSRTRAEHDAEVDHVAERLSMIRAEVEELERKRVEAQSLLGEEVSKAFGEIKSTIGELGSLTTVWTDARRNDEEARRVGLEAIQDITGILKEREIELDALLGSLGEQIKSDGERAIAEQAAFDARRRVDEMTAELKSVTVLCYDESERLAEYRREREEIRSHIIAEESRIADLLREKGVLSNSVAEITGTLSTLAVELRSIQCEIDALKRERTVHEGAIEELRRLRGNVLESYLQVENDLAAFTSQATGAAARAAELDRKSITLEAEIETRKAEIEAIGLENERLLQARARIAEENEAIERSALEARQEIETELELQLQKLGDTKRQLDLATEELRRTNAEEKTLKVDLGRLEEQARVLSERNKLVTSELDEFSTRVVELASSIAEKELQIGRLRESEGQMAARVERLEAEIVRFNEARSIAENQSLDARDRTKAIEGELVVLEKERVNRAMADLGELRELLRTREMREKENLERLLNSARVEYKQLRDDWTIEERSGVTNEELKKLRAEVEDKRREVVKAERQLSAMRAGLSKLREENGRSLLQRVQSFEAQQLEDLKRRIVESRSEIETLENDWSKEMKSAELVDKQWFEVKSTINNAQA